MDSVGGRLRKERERLGLNQTDFGAIGSIRRNAQMNYENGSRYPDSEYLTAIAKHGVDINYLITGERSISQETIDQELESLSQAWQAICLALQEANKTLPADKMKIAAEALYHAVKNGEGEVKPLAQLLTKAA